MPTSPLMLLVWVIAFVILVILLLKLVAVV